MHGFYKMFAKFSIRLSNTLTYTNTNRRDSGGGSRASSLIGAALAAAESQRSRSGARHAPPQVPARLGGAGRRAPLEPELVGAVEEVGRQLGVPAGGVGPVVVRRPRPLREVVVRAVKPNVDGRVFSPRDVFGAVGRGIPERGEAELVSSVVGRRA